ncbi:MULTISPECIES: substrate-binding domain-containing protein [unclassified Clostridium]|uniref:substrate-binding domain-containing protein n=1 Tax=unclassified Clostridium TaxID=2614128 RepID=UPI0002986136|nr:MULTISPECIES: substrate-binding domain-containing protein [unclassified Clostridium]EKQ52360.1 MAG: ABC-type tungstate transport system, permease component [Clostridium sp. Maddingley MBC34-26]
MKKLFAIVLLISLGGGVLGCGSNKVTSENNSSSKVQENKEVILGMTTGIEDAGLLDVIIPAFEEETGYKTKTVSVGTGQALALAQKGEVDAIFVNSPPAEKQALEEGYIINRRLAMHNDFVIVGPESDEAKIKGTKDVLQALTTIANTQSQFISRADDSGTNKLEMSLWKQTSVTPKGLSWYVEAGAGMSQTLKIANEKNAYTITDRATYLFNKKVLSLQVLSESDPKLINLYSVSEVNKEKFSRVNSEGAKAFTDFVLSEKGQELIAKHGKEQVGQYLFTADGGKFDKDYGL